MLAKFSLLHTNNSHKSLIGQKDEEKSLEFQIKSLLSSKKKKIHTKKVFIAHARLKDLCLFLSSQN
jgi:hypothetical protein